MKRRFPVVSVVLILLGAGGLAWFSTFQSGPGWGWHWRMGPWGAGRAFTGPGMMPGMGPSMMGGWWQGWYGKKSFASNGEQIYYTGTSTKTGPIPRSDGPMWVAMGGFGCVACHGVEGRGGVPVMMGTAIPADIRYEALIKGEYEHGEKEAPYTDSLIKRAITEGLDPEGKPLDWTMPRWQMGDADFNDLLTYLKTLR